jgi:polyisoprenoid-binding protein YceI
MIKTNFSKYFIVLLISTIGVFGNALSAQTLKLNPKTFSMTIFGTSSLHDFQSKVTLASGELVINSSKQAQTMVVEIPVKGIKSNEKLMDSKTYSAFDAEKNPMITFKLTDASSLQVTGSDIAVTATGNLTMAGVTRKVSLKSTGKIVKPGVYQFKGSITLKMTDFKMTPPSMLLIKVGDTVTLKYDLTFEGPAIN